VSEVKGKVLLVYAMFLVSNDRERNVAMTGRGANALALFV
jgi:hypothetical protein